MRLHRHQWAEVKRYFVRPGISGLESFRLRGLDPEEIPPLLHGETVVELRCEDCGDVTHRRLPGDAT